MGGNFCRRLGLPRSLGQIYGLLFLSNRALSLDEISETLRISKASVSTGARQLAVWGAIRQVWVPGARRDFFEAVPEIGRTLRDLYESAFKPRLESSRKRLDEMLLELDSPGAEDGLAVEERRHIQSQLRSLSRLHGKLQTVSSVLDKLI